MKVKEKSNQCWTLKNFPWISPTGAYSPYFYLFHLPSIHIPSYYLPRITSNRQTDRRKGTNFRCTPESDYYLCHYISWHQSSNCERDEGWEGVNSAISSSSLFDCVRVFNQNPTEISKQSWVIAKSHPRLKKKINKMYTSFKKQAKIISGFFFDSQHLSLSLRATAVEMCRKQKLTSFSNLMYFKWHERVTKEAKENLRF